MHCIKKMHPLKQAFLKTKFHKKKKSEEGTDNNKNHLKKKIKHFSF